jgi:hypothetical protein
VSVLDGVKMVAVEPPDDPGDLPFVTHEGVLEVMGYSLRCYRLSDGSSIINKEDCDAFMRGTGLPLGPSPFVQAMHG